MGFNGAATFRSRNAVLAVPGRRLPQLQWGRDLSVAECFRLPACLNTKRSFNGAATFRSRNVVARREQGAGGAASMGPRPFGRGMMTLDARWKKRLKLQWGRDLSVAEWAPPAAGDEILI